MNKIRTIWPAAGCLLFAFLLFGCSRPETAEDMIARNITLLFSAPDEYLTREGGAEEDIPAALYALEDYQPYLETVFDEEDFAPRLYSKLAQFRLVNLMYPSLCTGGITVEAEDVRVRLELEGSRVYSVEGQAVLTLGGLQETVPISGKVQMDEDGRISSLDFDKSAGEITERCLQQVNAARQGL